MIYIFTGDNDFLIKSEVSNLINTFNTTNKDFDIEKLDGDNLTIEQLKENLSTLSFFTSRRIIILQDLDKIKNIGDEIKEIFQNLDTELELIIIAKGIDKRSSLYLTLKKQSNFKEYKKLSVYDLIRWSESYLNKNKVEISNNDLNYLIRRVGDDQFLLKNELDKLMLLGNKITKKEINEITDQSINSKIFDLLNSAFEGNKKRTLQLYEEQRYLKVEPEVILSMMSWQLTNIAYILLGEDLRQDELIEISKLSPYTISNTKKLINKINYPKLTKLISELSDIDYKTKTSSFNLDEVLKNYLLSIS
jgi:DNA polymerase-3 subunit delta